jgi:hypothetical protein
VVSAEFLLKGNSGFDDLFDVGQVIGRGAFWGRKTRELIQGGKKGGRKGC